MSPATQFYRRHRHSLVQFVKFGLIGGSGVLVNLLVFAVVKNLIVHGQDAMLETPLLNLGEFAIRWKHVPLTLAFVIANIWNFQLNRTFTFKSAKHAKWIREFVPFFLVGLTSFAIGFLIYTALTNRTWPTHLPQSVFSYQDKGGNPLRDAYNWANIIQIICVTPLNFIFSKLWAFKSMSSKNVARRAAEADAAAGVDAAGAAVPALGADAGVPARTHTKPPCAD